MSVFIIVWAGQPVSTLGSGLTSFAVGVWVYQQTGSATLFAINMLVWVLPNIAMAPLAGVLADRWDRRLVMVLSDTGAGLSSLFIALMLLIGRLEVSHVYLATFFNSAFSAFQWPAYSAATSLLVPRQQLGRASGMTQTGEAISTLITPALAGALYVSAGQFASRTRRFVLFRSPLCRQASFPNASGAQSHSLLANASRAFPAPRSRRRSCLRERPDWGG